MQRASLADRSCRSRLGSRIRSATGSRCSSSELVTNAIQHGGAGEHETIQVRIASSYEKIRVEVFDPGPNAPGPRNRLEPQGGYGLLLVDRLATGWGRENVDNGGSLAWFELELDPTDHI